MDETLRLYAERRYEARVPVADIHHADAGGEIDIALPIDVSQCRAGTRGGEDGHRRRHAARQVSISLRLEFPGPWPWPLPHRGYPKGRSAISRETGGWIQANGHGSQAARDVHRRTVGRGLRQ